MFVYYESIKRELQIRPIYECRCDERLQTKSKEFTRLLYTGLFGGLEHLKDRDEVNRREDCEWDGWVCDLNVVDTRSKLSVIRRAAAFPRMFPK